MTSYAALPMLAAATLVLAIGLPLARSWLQYGTFALVFPDRELQRFLHATFSAALLGYGAWTLALVGLGPAALGVYTVPTWVSLAGLLVSGAGLVLVVAAQAQMGPSWRIGIDTEPTALVTHGVFRICRNPIYLGMLVVVAGITLVAPSGWTAVGLALVYVLVGFQARAEEEFLIREHGEAYLAWARRVGRFLPWVGRRAG